MKNFELSDDFFKYIENNSASDVNALRLRSRGNDLGFPVDLAITQIEARSKTSRKLSRFLRHREFLFPSTLAAEQSTHQAVALYHASIVTKGKRVVDLTAGLGIDAFTIAEGGNEVTAIELDSERADALLWNRNVLGVNSEGVRKMCVVEDDCLEWLRGEDIKDASFDVAFIDPARRSADNRRTYFLSDCVPDVVMNFDLLAEAAETIMIKASPIVDITSVIREIPTAREIHVVCVRNECKEVLIIANGKGKESENCEIKVVDLKDSDNLEVVSELKANYSELKGDFPIADKEDFRVGSYIYDPNAGLHKLNSAAVVCSRFPELKRASQNTDLYVSYKLYPDFPGRVFRIEAMPTKKDLKGLKDAPCEIISRNHPITADQIRAKLKTTSSVTNYLIALRTGPTQTPTFLLACRL